MKYSVIGLGKLGASMVAAIASRGFQVIGVDIMASAVTAVNSGHAPVYETDLEKTIAANHKNISATLDCKEAIANSEVTFVVVPTPSDQRGSFSLQYASAAFSQIGQALAVKNQYHLIVLTSTVLPGSTRFGLLPILENKSGKKAGAAFGLCYSPEFIALGSIIRDFLNPDFTLVGEWDQQAGDLLQYSYDEIMENHPPCKRMSIENAELTKIALNTFVTTKITFANMLAEFCEKIPGGDVDIVTAALGCDSRIGHKYLKGAGGYGGPCFPRDNQALSFIARKLGIRAELAETTQRFNSSLPGKIVKKLKRLISPGATVAILGLAYKTASDFIEESQGILIAEALVKQGFKVKAYDPLANQRAAGHFQGTVEIASSMAECLKQVDAVLLTTPDPAFKFLSPTNFSIEKCVIVIDFWRLTRDRLQNSSHIRYIATGLSRQEKANAKKLAAIWRSTGETRP